MFPTVHVCLEDGALVPCAVPEYANRILELCNDQLGVEQARALFYDIIGDDDGVAGMSLVIETAAKRIRLREDGRYQNALR